MDLFNKDKLQLQSSPGIVDNGMYVLAKKQLAYSAQILATVGNMEQCQPDHRRSKRGINYWESKDRKGPPSYFLHEQYLGRKLTRTGKSILAFGDNLFCRPTEVMGLIRSLLLNPYVFFSASSFRKIFVILGFCNLGEGYFSRRVISGI